jgi:hypothetical protein
MTVKFPEIIQVGAHKYKVFFPYHFRERQGCSAQVDHDVLEIRIDHVDCNASLLAETVIVEHFFHELIHCIDAIFLQRQIKKLPNSEDIIDGLAEGLAQACCAGQFPLIEEENPL